ncbi:MAG: GAF domain-containing protein, partial [Chloroflexi bacterium]|nr:GAF domain-containing protein [Chloroflexota bacterium]
MQTPWVRKLTPGEGWREVERLLTYFRWGVVGYVAMLWWLGVFHTVSAVGSWLTLLLGVGYVATVQVLVWGWYRPQYSVHFAFLDACVISIPVFASGGAASPLVWLYFFVLIAAAVRFDLAYSALIAFVVVASFVSSVATQPLYRPERDGALAWSWILLLVLATAFAWLVANAVARQRQAVVVAQTELREARRRSDAWQAMFELGGRLAAARSIPAALETAVAGALELTDREYAGALVRGGRREDALVVAICQRGARPQVGHRQPPTSGFEELIGKQRAFHTANSVGSFRYQLTSFFGFDVGAAAAIEIEGETMGLIVVSDGAPFDVGEREILQQVTHEVASTLERVRLLARERRRSTSLSALCEVSQAIGASLNVDEVLNCVVGSAVGLLAADAASFTLRDETGHPRVRAHRALGDGYLNRLEVSSDASLGATAFEQAQPVVIPDLLAVATPAAQVARADGLRSYLAVPVRDEGIVIGLLEVFGRARLRRWTAEDLGLLSALADQAAVAIANARLFQAERDTVLKLRQLEAHRSDFVAMLSHELRTPV